MILEYTIHEALVELPGIRKIIPKELLRELTKDDNYIMRLDVDADGNIHYMEIGYSSDKWTLAKWIGFSCLVGRLWALAKAYHYSINLDLNYGLSKNKHWLVIKTNGIGFNHCLMECQKLVIKAHALRSRFLRFQKGKKRSEKLQ